MKGTLLLKINSKSSGSCLLVSENEDTKKIKIKKRQIWLVDMQFSSHKYLSGINGKFGGSFLVMFVTFSVEVSELRSFESQKLIAKSEGERGTIGQLILMRWLNCALQ